jgi:hypothetical protein
VEAPCKQAASAAKLTNLMRTGGHGACADRTNGIFGAAPLSAPSAGRPHRRAPSAVGRRDRVGQGGWNSKSHEPRSSADQSRTWQSSPQLHRLAPSGGVGCGASCPAGLVRAPAPRVVVDAGSAERLHSTGHIQLEMNQQSGCRITLITIPALDSAVREAKASAAHFVNGRCDATEERTEQTEQVNRKAARREMDGVP